MVFLVSKRSSQERDQDIVLTTNVVMIKCTDRTLSYKIKQTHSSMFWDRDIETMRHQHQHPKPQIHYVQLLIVQIY